MTTLIYLHGFQSSGRSAKACLLGDYLAVHHPDVTYLRPTLPDTPCEAWQAIGQQIEAALSSGAVGLIGSSLGGFWSTCASERYGLPAVVINPAVHPQHLLQHFLGPQTNPYTGASYTLTTEHMQQLSALDIPQLTHPERFWLLQQQGDEVLDYRQASAYYAAGRVTLEAGGNHAFIGFERYCPEIVRFFHI